MCKYSHHEQFPAINIVSLNIEHKNMQYFHYADTINITSSTQIMVKCGEKN